jgi:PfaD family protein
LIIKGQLAVGQGGIRIVSTSAYLDLTLPLVYFRVKGIHVDRHGRIICPNKVIAKVSRVEVARKYLSPPPEKLLTQLVDRQMITAQEARLAESIPVAEDMTAEADSGGHTDNRPAIALLSTMLSLRDELADKYDYHRHPCVGLGGGIATPASAAAAFAMGAAYVLTGSVNQACVEAGTSETVRHMLAEASQADVTMAPAADMFEMGVKVQVLKRGTMFPLRAAKLYDLYSSYDSYDEIPEEQRTLLERDIFQCTFQQEWQQTMNYFAHHDPKQIQRAEKNPSGKKLLGNTFISIPFKIEGPMGNLKVTTLPPGAVGDALVGIMKRTLHLPVDIIQPILPGEKKKIEEKTSPDSP